MKKYLLLFLTMIFIIVGSLSLGACDLVSCGDFFNFGDSGEDENKTHIHEYIETVVSPTCEESGYTLHKCSCGDEYKDKETDALGHEFGEFYVAINPTCEEEGLRVRKCSRCDYKIEEEISENGHEYELLDTRIVSDKTKNIYECSICHNQIEKIEYGNDYEIYETNKLYSEPTNFKFNIVSDESENYIKENLEIYDASYDYKQYGDNYKLKFNIKKNQDFSNVWEISGYDSVIDKDGNISYCEGYIKGNTYIVELPTKISFLQYIDTVLYFTIEGSNEQNFKQSSNLKFLRNLEDVSGGYYPYSVTQNDEETYILTLGKIDGLSINDILVLGEIHSLEEVNQFSQDENIDILNEIFISKINSITKNENGTYSLILGEPELSEVYDSLDLNYNEMIEFEEDETTIDNFKKSMVGQLVENDDFISFVAAVNTTSQNYASERELYAEELNAYSFSEKINFDVKVKISGEKVKLVLTGTIGGKNGIELKTAKGTKVGSIKVNFEINIDVSFKINATYKLKYSWIFITGVDYFDISLKQIDNFSFSFNVALELDYSLNKSETLYYYNENTGKVHTYICTHIKYADLEASCWKVIDAEDVIRICSDETGNANSNECLHCKPYTRLSSDAFVYNTKTKVIHCCNCYHVSQMDKENMYIHYGTYNTFPKEYTIENVCDWCHPDQADSKAFEEELIDTLKYQDWEEKVKEIKDWVKESGVESYSRDGITICSMKYYIHLISVNIDVKYVLSFNLKASLGITYKQSHENIYGARIQNGRVKTYSSHTEKTDGPTLKLTGSLGFKTGLEVDVYLSVVGLSRWVQVGVYAQAGIYVDVSGIVYLTANEEENNFAAAKLDAGIYIDVGVYYKLFVLKGNYSIYNREFSLLTFGYDNAYYAYSNSISQIDLETSYTLTDEELLNVTCYNIVLDKAQKKTLSFDENELYTVNVSLASGENCYLENGVIYIKEDAPAVFTDELIISISGNTTWKKYVKDSSAFYLGEFRITIVHGEVHIHDFDRKIISEEYCAKAVTCLEKGLYYYSCSCGEKCAKTFEYGEPLKHSFTNYVSDKNATCLEDGTKTAKCDRCDETDTIIDVDSKLGHSYSEIWTTNAEYHWHQAICEHTNEIKDKGQHNWDDGVITKDSTYFEQGEKTYTCSICQKTYIEKLPIIKADKSFSLSLFKSAVPKATATEVYFGTRTEYADKIAGLTGTTIDDGTGIIKAYNNGTKYYVVNETDGKIVAPSSLSQMFYVYQSLTTIIFGESFDTSNVTSMSYMFSGCSKLTTLDVSNFDTSNVTSMSSMFNNCSNLTTIDLSNFDTSNVTNMGSMFSSCGKLTTLDVSNFDTSNVKNMSWMFSGCSNLTTLDVSNFDTSNVTSMYCMFYSCRNLTILDLSNFDTSNVINMGSMFHECSKLTTLDVSNFDTASVTNMGSMFSSCSNLTTVDVSNFDTSSVTDMYYMFSYCSNLTILDVSNFDTSNVTDMSWMFRSCSQLTVLDVSNFDTSNVTDMNCMFSCCSNLKTLDVSNFDTASVSDMSGMFGDCSKLTTLDVSNFDTSNVSNMSDMFSSCSNLTTLDVSNFDTSKVTTMYRMFHECSKLKTLDVSNFDTSTVTSMYCMFYSCRNLITLDVSNFDTNKVTNMWYMFSSCSNLTTLDVSNFDTSLVTNMEFMFSDCSELTKIYASDKFITTKVSNSDSMFFGCSALVGGAGTTYNSTKTDKTYARIDGGSSNQGYFSEK